MNEEHRPPRRLLEPVPNDDRDESQPRDPDAERHIIGAALTNPTTVDACARIITATDFYEPRHETIWRTLLHLRTEGHPTGAVAVLDRLRDTGTLKPDYLDGPYLHGCLTDATPLTDEAVYYARIVDRHARRRRGLAAARQATNILGRPGDETDIEHALTEARDALAETLEAIADPHYDHTWAPLDLEAAIHGQNLDPPPTMLTRNDGIRLIYTGAVHALSGESESGKTWIALLAAAQELDQDHRVTFIDFEDRADRVVTRLLALGAKPDNIRDHFAYIRPDRPLDDAGREALALGITDTNLVIIDGVTEAMTLHGLALESNADTATFYGLLPRWIADHGPAVILIDHVVKDEEKRGRFAIGAQHKLAGIDAASYLVKAVQPFGRGKRGVARITVAKDRPGHVREHTYGNTIAEFVLDATRGDHVVIAELTPPGEETGRGDDGWQPTHLMEKVSRYVQTHPGISGKAIETAIRGKATAVRLSIELLISGGYLRTEKGPRNAVLHYHQNPFREHHQQPDDEDE